jgi:hypothetical protein
MDDKRKSFGEGCGIECGATWEQHGDLINNHWGTLVWTWWNHMEHIGEHMHVDAYYLANHCSLYAVLVGAVSSG